MSEQENAVVEQVSFNELVVQLTKKNQQYVYDLNKVLEQSELEKGKRQHALGDVVKELVSKQKQGITARQLFGTVSNCAKTIIAGPVEDLSKPSPAWKLFIDGGLLMGSLFMILTALTSNQRLGITTLLLNYIIAGFAMLLVTNASVRYQAEMQQQSQARWIMLAKYMGWTVLGMTVWLGGMVAVMLLPSSINPYLPASYYVVIGVITFVLKLYLKKKLNIRGGLF